MLILLCHAVVICAAVIYRVCNEYLDYCSQICSIIRSHSISFSLFLSFTGPVLYMLSVPSSGGLFKSTAWEHCSTVFWTVSPFFTNCTWSWAASCVDCSMQFHHSPSGAPATKDHSACHKVRPRDEQSITYSDFTNS